MAKDIIENTVTFKENTDKGVISTVHPQTQESLMEITGYDLQFKFNMNMINSEEDIDNVVKSAAECFRCVLINQLIDKAKTID